MQAVRRRQRTAEYLLSGWQRVMLTTMGDGIGYASRTTLARAASGELSSHAGGTGARLPAHVDLPGMSGFTTVERVLKAFSKAHRHTLLVEMVHPVAVVGRTQRQRAEFMGVLPGTYIHRLRRIREALRDDGCR